MASQLTHSTLHEGLSTPSTTIPSRANQLLAVFCWELRRGLASHANQFTAVGAFGICLLIVWGNAVVGGIYQLPAPHGTLRFTIPYTSVWGLATTLPESPGIIFGLFFPFICTDGVARDLTRRTHELLMTTPLSSSAYIWGRYLASLLLSFCLACLFLVSIIVATVLLHVKHADSYPPLVLPSVIAIWALIVLPPAVLLSGFSFALGTLLPRRSNLVKVGVLLSWLVGGESLEVFLLRPANPSWQALWDPTSIAPEILLNRQLYKTLSTHAQDMGVQAFLRYVRAYQQTMPDLRSWVGPHLAWAALGVAAVVGVSLSFRRFRNTVGLGAS
jgi:hypothetical protein